MSRCGEASLARIGGEVAQVVTQRCKCASCEECAPGYSRRVSRVAASGEPKVMLTVTAPPCRGRTPRDQARLMQQGVEQWRQYWNRHNPKRRIEWFWVVEKHKNGQPHLHILSPMPFIPVMGLWRWMNKLMGTRQIKIKQVENQAAAAFYCGKYLGKDPAKFHGVARWGRTRGYGLRMAKVERMPELAAVRWERVDERSYAIVHRMIRKGWRIDPEIKWCTRLCLEPWARPLSTRCRTRIIPQIAPPP